MQSFMPLKREVLVCPFSRTKEIARKDFFPPGSVMHRTFSNANAFQQSPQVMSFTAFEQSRAGSESINLILVSEAIRIS